MTLLVHRGAPEAGTSSSWPSRPKSGPGSWGTSGLPSCASWRRPQLSLGQNTVGIPARRPQGQLTKRHGPQHTAFCEALYNLCRMFSGTTIQHLQTGQRTLLRGKETKAQRGPAPASEQLSKDRTSPLLGLISPGLTMRPAPKCHLQGPLGASCLQALRPVGSLQPCPCSPQHSWPSGGGWPRSEGPCCGSGCCPC